LFGVVAAIFLVGGSAAAEESEGAERVGPPARRVRVRPSPTDDFDSGFDGFRDGFDDDDDYVEYTLSPPPTAAKPRVASQPVRGQVHEPRTEPLTVRIEHPRPAPAESWHSSPVETWRSLLDDTTSEAEPIGFAHNGFHVEHEQRFSSAQEFPALDQRRVDYDEPFFDDIDTYGGASDHAPRSRDAGPRGERNGYHLPPRERHGRTDRDPGS
jgi:hypothetical protein